MKLGNKEKHGIEIGNVRTGRKIKHNQQGTELAFLDYQIKDF